MDIAGFVQEIASGAGAPSQTNGDGPLTKKRKLESSKDWETGSHKTIKELSFSIPQRKKFTLEIGDRKTQGLRAKNPTTGDVEFAVNWNDLGTTSYLKLLRFFPQSVLIAVRACFVPTCPRESTSTIQLLRISSSQQRHRCST